MIELKKDFSKRGTNFHQLYKDDKVAIYRCDKCYGHYYEVIKVTIHKPDKHHDDDYELYPCDEYFGRYGWCCSDENVVAKVMSREFGEHELTALLSKFIDGSYVRNDVNVPHFNLTEEELYRTIANLPRH